MGPAIRPTKTGLRPLTASQVVDVDRGDQHAACHDDLPFLGNVYKLQAVGEHIDDECADDGPEDRALATAQGGPAYDDRGDGAELVAEARRGLCRAQAGGRQDAREPREETADDVDEDLPVGDVDAGEACRLLV